MKLFKQAKDFAVGSGKGAMNTLTSVPNNIQNVVSNSASLGVSKDLGRTRDDIVKQNQMLMSKYKRSAGPQRDKYKTLIQSNIDIIMNLGKEEDSINGQISRDASWIPGDRNGSYRSTVNNAIVPTNAAQRAGFNTEKFGELVVPAFATGGIDARIDKLAPFASNLGNSVARSGMKAALDAGVTGASTIGQAAYQGRMATPQQREDVFKDAGRNSILAGALRFATAGLGEGAKAIKTHNAGIAAAEEALGTTRNNVGMYDQMIKGGDMPYEAFYKDANKTLSDMAKKNLAQDLQQKMVAKLGENGPKKAQEFLSAIEGKDLTYDQLEKLAFDIARKGKLFAK